MAHFAATCAALGIVLLPLLYGAARILIATEGRDR